MKTNRFQYVKLTPYDGHIPFLLEIHSLPEISKYIGIDREKYFDYVTGTNHVDYFKVMLENKIVAAVHIEKQSDILYLSILVLPEHQNKGFGAQILEDIKSQRLAQGFSKIIVSIDKTNTPSIKLFEKHQFVLSGEDDDLLEYHLDV